MHTFVRSPSGRDFLVERYLLVPPLPLCCAFVLNGGADQGEEESGKTEAQGVPADSVFSESMSRP